VTPCILIADSDPELRELYQQFFSRHGWRSEAADGGIDCLAWLRRVLPHVLVLDAQLPWGGADGLLAVMRTDVYLHRVPVILTSLDAVRDTLPPPVVDVMMKPFPLNELLETALCNIRIGERWAGGGGPIPSMCN
jgi:DNA-binding response OmpR family regulator